MIVGVRALFVTVGKEGKYVSLDSQSLTIGTEWFCQLRAGSLCLYFKCL